MKKKNPNQCESIDCAGTALFKVHWPGHPIKMCRTCADRAQFVSERGMGVTLEIEPLPGAMFKEIYE